MVTEATTGMSQPCFCAMAARHRLSVTSADRCGVHSGGSGPKYNSLAETAHASAALEARRAVRLLLYLLPFSW